MTFHDHAIESIRVKEALAGDTAFGEAFEAAASLCIKTLTSGGKVLIAGNGGSAADAQHFAGELVSRFYFDRPGLAAVALTVDTSILTAIGNDYGFEKTFSRQVQALGATGDLFIGISTSGRSPNILAGLQEARARGLATIGLTGRTGGTMGEHCDLCLKVPSDSTPRIQEGHSLIVHALCATIESRIFGGALEP
ncbi:D-sedoheptulose 7-phosphate isomerase [Mesoterricola sediminis]|nr:D-sedoheptulose 7-phosphate isomerase [Mesoterricola sediminis]